MKQVHFILGSLEFVMAIILSTVATLKGDMQMSTVFVVLILLRLSGLDFWVFLNWKKK
jgi:hypothetical protein